MGECTWMPPKNRISRERKRLSDASERTRNYFRFEDFSTRRARRKERAGSKRARCGNTTPARPARELQDKRRRAFLFGQRESQRRRADLGPRVRHRGGSHHRSVSREGEPLQSYRVSNPCRYRQVRGTDFKEGDVKEE